MVRRYYNAVLAQRANPGDSPAASRLQRAVSDLDAAYAR
jgi:hypothetical protein